MPGTGVPLSPCLLLNAAVALHQSTAVAAAHTCAGRLKSRRNHRPPPFCQLRLHPLPPLDACSAAFAPPLLKPPLSPIPSPIRAPPASLCTSPASIQDTGAPPSSPRLACTLRGRAKKEEARLHSVFSPYLFEGPRSLSEATDSAHRGRSSRAELTEAASRPFAGARRVWTRTAASATVGRRSGPGPPATATAGERLTAGSCRRCCSRASARCRRSWSTTAC